MRAVAHRSVRATITARTAASPAFNGIFAPSVRFCASAASGTADPRGSANSEGEADAKPKTRFWESSTFQVVGGFAGGFGAWLAFEQSGLVDDASIASARAGLRTRLHHLRHGGVLGEAVQSTLDGAGLFVVDPPQNALDAGTADGESGSDDRASFADVLRSCALPEQLDWLTEHVTESIPYFYIEELVHTFGCLHFARRMYGYDPATCPAAGGDKAAVAALVRSESAIFEGRAKATHANSDGADDLIRGIWHLLAGGIVAPQAGWSALAVLAEASPRNAIALAKHIAVDTGAVPTPYAPTKMVKVTPPPMTRLPEDGDGEVPPAADESAEPVLIPQYRQRHAEVASEAEALACFAAVVDAARRVTVRAARSGDADATPDAPTDAALVACGPPVDLVTPRNGAAFEKRPVKPPRSVVAAATARGAEPGAAAAAMDPLVVTLAAVDAALSQEAERHQRRRYGASWLRPWTWHRCIGLGSPAPPSVHEAASRGATLPLMSLASGAGANSAEAAEPPRSAERDGPPRQPVKRDPTLPFRVSHKDSLARALELVTVPAPADDEQAGVAYDPEGLSKWLRDYALAASRNAAEVSTDDDTSVCATVAAGRVTNVAKRVALW